MRFSSSITGAGLALLATAQSSYNGTGAGNGSSGGSGPITASGTNFTLTANGMSYLMHVDPETLDLSSDHFGGPSDGFLPPPYISPSGWSDNLANTRREFPDIGRSDFRMPAIHVKHGDGSTVSAFLYDSYEIVAGKPSLPGLPATFGEEADVSTLMVRLYDNYTNVGAVLSYSIFPEYNAIARSFQITNNGTQNISIERAASFSLDMPNLELDLIELQGDWSHERNRVKRSVAYGETSFRSNQGYSGHIMNPFFALVSPHTTESHGEAWGFNLVYTGDFAATADRGSQGFVRVLLGLNPLMASLPLAPGDTFTSPEAVAVYSSEGTNGMSQSFHDLYRNHLSRSNYTSQTRPVLLNSWEGLGADINQTALDKLASETADLGISLFVMDDGWFGNGQYARVNDTAGLGDWQYNRDRFPNGLGPFVGEVNDFSVDNSSQNLEFGIWVEPEMVNPNSTLYQEHPEWAMHSGNYPRTLTRNQLVLNLAMPEVQDFIIDAISNIIDSANISYIKWDNNRGMHEMPSPATDYYYMLGMYHVIDTLSTKYPQILWEGCASGGGRFDAGLLYYWPQHWTSDNTDASDRLTIQLGTSMAYPMSSMGCHVSAVPNGVTNRNISIDYRAHVALMCGSFGFELNPEELSAEERAAIPGILDTWERINPIVISGDFYRLRLPEESNWPAAQFVSEDGSEAAVFAFQQKSTVKPAAPPVRLQGLDPEARYSNSYDNATYSGATYMNAGMNVQWTSPSGTLSSDYLSELIWLVRE